MNLITKIRKSRITKGLALCLALNMISEIVWPTAAMALTSGPSQPEVQSFEPVETTDMVNMFTGDFTYNIPLMYLPGPNGGYPINLSYHGGVGMDQEASWVGLGWNINAGALVRDVRGFADDYNGDELITKVDMKENVTVGLNYGASAEIFGGDPDISLNASVRYNNYKGFAIGFGAGFPMGNSDRMGMGLTLDSETGLGASVQFSVEGEKTKGHRYSAGLSYDNEGLGISFSRSKVFSETVEKTSNDELEQKGHEAGHRPRYLEQARFSVAAGQSGLGFSANTHAPMIGLSTKTDNMNVYIKFGAGVGGVFANQSFGGFFNIQGIDPQIAGVDETHKVYGFENYQNSAREDIMDFTREKDGTITPMTPNLAAPNLTYDIYSVLGQGIGGNFRPFRTDVGRVYDPFLRSHVSGNSSSYDIGNAHVGFGGTITSGYSVQRPWDYKNNWANDYMFRQQVEIQDATDYDYQDRERVYYRMHGDKSSYDVDELDFIGGVEPVLTGANAEIGDELDLLLVPADIKPDRHHMTVTGTPPTDLDIRIARNILIHKLKNADLTSLYNDVAATTITSPTDLANQTDLTETSVFYYNWADGEDWLLDGTNAPADPAKFLDRATRNDKSIAGHNGAYKILNENGQYYVYALPAYNTKEVEAAFSVDQTKVVTPSGETNRAANLVEIETENAEIKYKYSGTDKYLNKTTKPPYAHSYMLTSVLGADYVDVDDNGPSDADLGYWVKFDYVKYAGNYKWRAPFQGASYSAGALTTAADDKGSYLYGEKEMWYVSRIETKTHVVVFDLAKRNDNYEASGEFNAITGGGNGSNSGLLIEKISLYLKEDYKTDFTSAVPLQEVHFEYDYSLCGNVKNNDGAQTGLPSCVLDNTEAGKLTLRRIWITYEGSDKGQMRPYEFNYFNEPGSTEGVIGYNEFMYDRWGNYKSDGNAFAHKFLPYVNQTESQAQADNNASAWSLKTIHLPSGGDINMTYEADDYGYVQSEEATQMFPITKVNDMTTANNTLYEYNDNNSGLTSGDMDNPTARRVYFKLEEPLASGLSADQYAQKIYRDYVEGLLVDSKGERNLYFKNYTQLRSEQDNTYDYISGYVPIEDYYNDNLWTIPYTVGGTTTNYYKYGINTASLSGGVYTEGFITIKQHIRKIDKNSSGSTATDVHYEHRYHPFSLAAWEHMRLNDPLMLTTPSGMDLETGATGDEGSKAQLVSSLLGFIPQTIQMFTGVWTYCYQNNHARRIDLTDGRSVIRLCSPDKTKRGGGQRVKQIAVSDNWDNFSSETEQVTGVVYDYTVEEDDHGTPKTISSGVAAYEPLMGGDEIALRYPKFYPDNVPFNSDNRSYFEYPVNEQYFPAPVVGYRKVIVRSLNTATQMQIAEAGPDPDGIGTTGITEYEFYTAKDFPVIIKESEIIKSKLNLPIPIPFVGMFERQKIKAAQGYVIELNDMHGQVKAVTKYGLNADYSKNPYATSSVIYKYLSEGYPLHYDNDDPADNKTVFRLINEVETINHDNNTDVPSTEARLVGVEYDFFTDQRQNKSHTIVAGGYGNTDIVSPGTPIPVPSFWPALTTVKHDCKTFVTNKIIFRSGLVSEVHTYDGRARVITKNEVYDEQAGRPIIMSVNNEFEDIIYNYSHPAHWEYDRMGGAYKNIDLKFDGKIVAYRSAGGLDQQFILETTPNVLPQLVSGDVLLVKYDNVEEDAIRAFTATYLKKSAANQGVIYVEKNNGANEDANYVLANGTMCDFMVIRSGRRNHVFADAGTIVSKNKPVTTASGAATRYSQNLNLSETIAGGTWTGSLKLTWMHKVLNGSAVQYKDEWENAKTDDNNNPFRNGEAGIWRPYKSYVYVGDREAGPDPYVPTVKTDIRDNGEMNDFKFFNWQVQNYEKYVPEWQWVSEITKYSSEAYELENTDRLNIKSAALYAYSGSLVVGVGANAGYHELGAEDFERYTAGGTVSIGALEADDNLGFYNSEPGGTFTYSSDVQRTYRIVNGLSKINGIFWIELETTDDFTLGTEVELAIKTSNFATGGKSDSFLFTGEVTGYSDINGHTLLVVQTKYKFFGSDLSMIDVDSYLTGRATVSVTKTSSHSTNIGEVAFVSGKAHTGKQSMKFKEASFFPQGKLDLIKDKTYVLSAWVSRDDIRKIDYEGIGIEVRRYTGTGWTDISNTATLKKSKVIEGWQKIEFEFTPDVENATIGILLSSTVGGTPTFAYIDDIRISPKTGGIVTYVYDSHNYRLKATLDNNNYATFYYYDEEGNLYQVKRETAHGIQTVSENRGHTKVQ
ncbi:MAG: hypothetical protein HYZ14_16185 [Bacteroidetes bacterium]|nr:hypothetical protein [Bacteroidota bacterium]